MKKILLLSNGHSISPDTLQYAVNIAKHENAYLQALFTSSLKPEENKSIDKNYTGQVTEETILNLENNQVENFKNICSSNNIAYQVYKIRNNFLDSVIDQSIFSDLIICDEKMDQDKFSLSHLMANAHCPVLTIPKSASTFTEIILTFDESSSSMHSIKQFTYLFSSRLYLPTYLVSILPRNIIGLEYGKLLDEWLHSYYPNITLEILKGKEEEELPAFINMHKNAVVVMGAFGRSSLSRLFKSSLANIILDKTKSVIFTTHD